MIVCQWHAEVVNCIAGLSQEVRIPADWPYSPDWIVSSIAWDEGNRCYWIEGRNNEGAPFFWGAYPDRPLSWRYDLRNARYSVGRHETKDEAIRRENADRMRVA